MSTGSELQTKGIRLFEGGKYDEAAAIFTEAIAAYQSENSPELSAEMQVNLGLTKREQGDFEGAVEMMQTGLAYFRENGIRLREAQALGNMALVYAKAGDHEQAQTMYREAAAIFRELGEDQFYGETILALGDMLFRAGKLQEALAIFEVGLERMKNKNQRQKVMKQLLVLKNRIMGEERRQQVNEAENQGETDSHRRRRRSKRNKTSDE